jgi:hypothetical protein
LRPGLGLAQVCSSHIREPRLATGGSNERSQSVGLASTQLKKLHPEARFVVPANDAGKARPLRHPRKLHDNLDRYRIGEDRIGLDEHAAGTYIDRHCADYAGRVLDDNGQGYGLSWLRSAGFPGGRSGWGRDGVSVFDHGQPLVGPRGTEL